MQLFRMLDEAISRAANSLNQAVAAILKCSPESSDTNFSSKGEVSYISLLFQKKTLGLYRAIKQY